MADIFISYSSKDREKAEQLTELLGSAGLSVWIDKSALEVSTSWSAEIVDAITSCSAFIVLLSPNSIESHNVIKEVSLASEKRKKILPLDLEPIMLPRELEYQLAGIHRTSMTNIDSIIRALGKLGLEATQAPTLKIVKETDSRKSLMILPFQDLSPTGDNAWFADGIVTELIDSLSPIKSLRLTDKQTTKEYKSYNGHLASYAKEMHIRYFLQGDVRKFGDQIKISCSLLDIETGDHLWQIAHKGTMSDIFDMQEEVAKKVVDGLKIHLPAAEKEKLSTRETENAEAYEMYLKAEEFFGRSSKVDTEYALKAVGQALELDPHFDRARLRRAIILIAYYHDYQQDPKFLDEAEQLIAQAGRTISAVDDWRILGGQALLAWARGDSQKALALHLENIRVNSDDYLRHSSLAHFYAIEGRYEEAVAVYEKVLEINPEGYPWARELIGLAWQLNRDDLKVAYSQRCLPLFEKRMKTVPEDDDAVITYGLLLAFLGRLDEARRHLDFIPDDHVKLDYSFRNIAELATRVGQPERAINMLERLLTKEFSSVYPEWLNESEFDSIRDHEGFIRVKQAFEERAKQHG